MTPIQRQYLLYRQMQRAQQQPRLVYVKESDPVVLGDATRVLTGKVQVGITTDSGQRLNIS